MYHTYPYKAQIPVLIEGKYETRTFISKDDVWGVIDLIIAETKEENENMDSLLSKIDDNDVAKARELLKKWNLIGSKNQVRSRCSPFRFSRGPVRTREPFRNRINRFPRGLHVE